MNRITLNIASLVLLSLGAAISVQAAGKTCNKTCLSDVTEQYVEAMVRGSIKGLPMAKNVRATSNSEVVKPGEGETWQQGITLVNRYTFMDTATGTSVFYGTVAGKPQDKRTWWHYGLRLMVDGEGAITEIEELSNHIGLISASEVETPFKEAAIFESVLPNDERVDSAELIRVADTYFDGLTSGDGEDVLFGPDCQRSEFGAYTTNNFKSLNAEPTIFDKKIDNDFVAKAMTGPSCRSVFYVDEMFHWPIDNRRFYVTDEARGVVVAAVQFHKFGEKGFPGLTIIEAFKIVNGRIDSIWAPTFTFGSEKSGWPDWQR